MTTQAKKSAPKSAPINDSEVLEQTQTNEEDQSQSSEESKVGVNFSDLKTVREAIEVSVLPTELVINGVVFPFPSNIMLNLIRAGFYHSTSDETTKIKVGTAEKDAAVKTIIDRWQTGYFTATEQRQVTTQKTALLTGSGTAKKPAYGRQEILGLLAERMPAEQVEKIRSYDDSKFSGFLIKYMDSALLRGVYADLDKAREAAALREAQAVINSVDDFDII